MAANDFLNYDPAEDIDIYDWLIQHGPSGWRDKGMTAEQLRSDPTYSYVPTNFAEQFSQFNFNRLKDRANQIASNFKKNLPEYQKGLLDVAAKSNRQQLASQIKAQNQDLSSRGLLSGGIAQAKTAEASERAKADLMGKQKEIQDQAQEDSTQMQDFATNLGLNTAGMKADEQNQYFKDALESMRNRNQLLNQVGQSAGYAAGTYFGKGS